MQHIVTDSQMDALTGSIHAQGAELAELVAEVERLRTVIELGCNTLAPDCLYAGLHSKLMAALRHNN